MEDSKLTQALILNLDQEINEYERNQKSEPAHLFSSHYQRKKKQILRLAEKGILGNAPALQSRRFRFRRTAVLIAAIVAVLAAATAAAAIVKPEVFYIIKEKITNWTITFDNSSTEKPAFAYIKPPVPEGYQIIDETKGPDFYYLTFRNESGQEISYDQNDPDSVSISIDSEQTTPKKESIEGVEVIISEHDGIAQIMYTDNRYVYVIDGNCEKDVLYNIVKEMIKQE